jgi:hypothetical protein
VIKPTPKEPTRNVQWRAGHSEQTVIPVMMPAETNEGKQYEYEYKYKEKCKYKHRYSLVPVVGMFLCMKHVKRIKKLQATIFLDRRGIAAIGKS